MPGITLVPTGTKSGWRFELDGQRPQGLLGIGGGEARLFWQVKLGSDHKVRLSTGGTLNDIEGHVGIQIGTATPNGQTHFGGSRSPLWGALYYFPAQEGSFDFRSIMEAYIAELHVSSRLFDRLQALVAAGRLPTIHISLGDESTLLEAESPPPADAKSIAYGKSLDGRELDWDNKNFQAVTIKWCTFEVNAGSSTEEGDDCPDTDKSDDGLAPPTKSDLRNLIDKMTKTSEQIHQLTRHVVPALWACAILLVALVFRR